MSAKKVKKIVFVCTGNTCRSPMAQALLSSQLTLMGIEGYQAFSAGTAARADGVLNPLSAQVLLENGLTLDGFTSTPLNEEVLLDAKAIVCMTEAQRDEVAYMRWKILNDKGRKRINDNVYCFSSFCGREVPDPYGYGIEEYRYVFSLMQEGMYALMDKLLKKELKALLEKEGGVVESTPKKKGSKSKKTAKKA
jgi:protein-tyrosine-phosphatase